LLRSSTGAAMPKQSRRVKIFAAGRRAAVKNWRVRAVPATGAVWVTRAGWARKVAAAAEGGWGIRGVARVVGGEVWETALVVWVTVGVRGWEVEAARVVVEG